MLSEVQSDIATYVIADAVVEQANWDTSKVRDKLHRDIDAHIVSVRTAKLSELTALYEVIAHFIKCLLIPIFLGECLEIDDMQPRVALIVIGMIVEIIYPC